MAESIIIHTHGSNAIVLAQRVAQEFGEAVEGVWRVPQEDYLLTISRYRDFEAEYDPADKAEVVSKLGGSPSKSFDFEIRRTKSDAACDLLEAFVRQRLSDIEFVVDDMFRILSRSELEEFDGFLTAYRYESKMQNKTAHTTAGNAPV